MGKGSQFLWCSVVGRGVQWHLAAPMLPGVERQRTGSRVEWELVRVPYSPPQPLMIALLVNKSVASQALAAGQSAKNSVRSTGACSKDGAEYIEK
jgi:hypothetical protein